MNAWYGIWKRMVYWLNNSVVIGQIDRQLIISFALRHLLEMLYPQSTLSCCGL